MLTANVTWYRSKNSPVVHVKQKGTKTWAFWPHVLQTQSQGFKSAYRRKTCKTTSVIVVFVSKIWYFGERKVQQRS